MSTWKPYVYAPPPPAECDLCFRPAAWQHPLGGFRCKKCPRPEAKP